MGTFEGHAAPVHSVCPHNKENVHFFFSTSVNGKIKAWLCDNMGYRVDYDAPGHSITTMAYGAMVKVYAHLKLVGRVQEAGYLIVLQKRHTWQLNIQIWLGFRRKWHCLVVIMVISREHGTRLNPQRGTRDSKLGANVTNPWNEWVVHKA